MAAEKNPKKPQEARSDDEPRSHVPEGKGTLRIRVSVSAGIPLALRRVSVTSKVPRLHSSLGATNVASWWR